MEKKVKLLACFVNFIVLWLLACVIHAQLTIPDSYKVTQGEQINLGFLGDTKSQQVIAQNSSQQIGTKYSLDLSLLGTIPIKQVDVTIVDRKMLYVGGAPFGITMYTDGLMVVGMSQVASEGQRITPAREAGVEIGDIIKEINGEPLTSNKQLGAVVEQSDGAPVTLLITKRNILINFCRVKRNSSRVIHPRKQFNSCIVLFKILSPTYPTMFTRI